MFKRDDLITNKTGGGRVWRYLGHVGSVGDHIIEPADKGEYSPERLWRIGPLALDAYKLWVREPVKGESWRFATGANHATIKTVSEGFVVYQWQRSRAVAARDIDSFLENFEKVGD